jgi:hypothetical protein
MRERYTSVANGQPISQEELDLIFDYTCDACEAYISTELIDKHGWDLRTCESFLTGKHPNGNKIRYCSETITTSILNLKFASQFDSLSRPKSVAVPNFAHLTLTNSAIRGPSNSFGSLPPYAPASAPPQFAYQSHPSLPFSTPTPNQFLVSNGETRQTISSFSSSGTHVTISPASMPQSPPPAYTTNNPSAISPRAVSSVQAQQIRHSAPIPNDHHHHHHHHHQQQQHLHLQQHPSAAAHFDSSFSTNLNRANTAPIKLHSTFDSNLPITSSSGSSISTSKDVAKSSSPQDSLDGRVKRQPCSKLTAQGFCSPRDCPHSHSPTYTMCKWLTMNGFCETHGCTFQHPNTLTREAILAPIHLGSPDQRALSSAEWQTLQLTMVFYCPIPMKDKKCGKGAECKVNNCPKQHKRPKRESRSLSFLSSSFTAAISISSSSSLISSSSSTNSLATTTTMNNSALPLSKAPPPLPPKLTLKLKDVTSQANHMNLVTSIMQGGCAKSAKPLKIIKLEEISNSPLDEQYHAYFMKTHQIKGLRPSEIYAFHGAPSLAVQAIAAQGFDMSKIKRTKFGHGLYCALDANVSVDYCGDGNKMLLVRLITDGLKWVKDPAYYVVQDQASMNPLYIITFDKN